MPVFIGSLAMDPKRWGKYWIRWKLEDELKPDDGIGKNIEY